MSPRGASGSHRRTIQSLRSTPAWRWALYFVSYCLIGLMNQRIGQAMHLAEFSHDWQIITCYGLYLVPCSLAVRELPAREQYLWGLLALGILELLGYSLETSIAHPNNAFDQVLGVRNFSLAMTLMFAGLLPAGNLLMVLVERAGSWARARGSSPEVSRTR